MIRRAGWLATLLLALATLAAEPAEPPGKAELAGDDPRAALGDVNVAGADHWIYNDLDKAFAEARSRKKPLFVVFRCVPTRVNAAFDEAVTRSNEKLVEMARNHFVCVRVVDLRAVDLSRFQFDYDLSWAAMFLNADGTVYGRFGTQSTQLPNPYNHVAGLERAMLRVLALHSEYPTNAPGLAGKRGPPKSYKTALEVPGLEDKESLRGPTTRTSCLRCHALHDAEHNEWQAKAPLTVERLWRYPLPGAIGLQIEPRDGTRVEKVAPASAAALAGLRAGDVLLHLNRQPIVSIADMQWVLHHLPATNATVEVEFTRLNHLLSARLQLGRNWKATDFSWRASVWSIKPRLAFWSEEITDDEMLELRRPSGTTALRVTRIDTSKPEGRAAEEAGLRPGDIIIAVAGKALSLNPREFLLFLKQSYKGGDKVPLTVIREGKLHGVQLPLVQ
jgi:hypothetical protein